MIFFKKVITFLSSLRWLLPFTTFFCGYWLCASFTYKRQVTVPALVGKTVAQALESASELDLTIRRSAAQVRSDITPGIVLDQTPQPGALVNVPQVVGITVSERPTLQQIEKLLGKKESDLKAWAFDKSCKLEMVSVKSNYPSGYCCAQFPAVASSVEVARIKAYVASPQTSYVIVPHAIGKLVQEVADACRAHEILLTVFHREPVLSGQHVCTHCVVLDQMPAAGSVVSKKSFKAMHVQVGIAFP